jgi:methyl-accepting chemotaxis protein
MKIRSSTKYMLFTILLLSLLIVSVKELSLVAPVYSQETPAFIKATISSTVVYRGYQVIEVVAYLYLPPGSSLVSASGYVTLSSGGLTQNLSMTLVELSAPITVTVDNKSYTVSRLLVVRVPVSFGLSPGPATLTVYTTGLARIGNATYDLTKIFRFTVTILDHTSVELKRSQAYLSLERAKALFDVLQSLGVSIPTDLRNRLDQLSESLSKADETLYVLGDVDKALEIYTDVVTGSEKVSADALLLMSSYFSGVSNKLSGVEARLDALNASVDSLSKSVSSLAESIKTLNDGLGTIAKTLSNYSASMRDTVAQLNTNIENTNKKIDSIVNSINSDLNNKLNSLVNSINKNFENINNALSAIQTALIVLGVAVLVIGAIGFLRR